jgi:hypothetical protein
MIGLSRIGRSETSRSSIGHSGNGLSRIGRCNAKGPLASWTKFLLTEKFVPLVTFKFYILYSYIQKICSKNFPIVTVYKY